MVLKLSPAVILTAILATAQEPTQQPIRVESREVIVPVTVRTEKGAFVTGLKKEDFEIIDQGKPQTITYFSGVPNQPVVVGFLLDLSSSSRTQWKSIQEAAVEAGIYVGPRKQDPSRLPHRIREPSRVDHRHDVDPDKIAQRIQKVSPSGGSALNDAIYMAASTNRKLLNGEPYDPRRVVVIIGDGHDNASSHTLEQAIELAQRISGNGLLHQHGSLWVLERFQAKTSIKWPTPTGGRVEEPLQNVYKDVPGFLNQPSDFGNYQLKVGTGAYAKQIMTALDRSVVSITGEVTQQYILRYTPNNVEDARLKHDLKVNVNLPGIIVNARPYYYPNPVNPVEPVR